MTEKSILWSAPTTGDGAAAYTEDETTRLFRMLAGGSPNSEGVLYGVDNQLAVSGAASPLSVATGAAFVYGLFYWNTAVVSVAVPTPVVGTTGHRVVLRALYGVTRTVRIALVSSADGNPAIPGATQTLGVQWEISLASLTITTGGVITLTDARAYCHFGKVATGQLDDNAVSNAKLRDSAAVSVIGRAAGTGGDVADIAASADGQVLHCAGGALAFAQAVTADIADDAVDDTKAGNRVPQFYRRQGGSATVWAMQGTTTFTPTAVRMQAGAVALGAAGLAASGSVAITYPVAFSNYPLVFVWAEGLDDYILVNLSANDQAGMTVLWKSEGGGMVERTDHTIFWLAIGPE